MVLPKDTTFTAGPRARRLKSVGSSFGREAPSSKVLVLRARGARGAFSRAAVLRGKP